MKAFKVNNKRSGLLVKGITILSLSIALQGKVSCVGQRGGTGEQVDPITRVITHKTKAEDLPSTLKELKGSLTKKIKFILYDLVNRGEHKKLKEVLTFCNEEPELDSGLKDLFAQALQALHGNKTLLGIAIEKGDQETFDLLVNQKGVDINQAGEQKEKNPTTLLLALGKKRLKIAEHLLTRSDIDIKAIDPISGNTTLHLAIKNGWENTAKKLIKRFKETAEALLFAQNNKGNTPLHSAMKHELPDVQRELIQLVAEDKKELSIKNDEDETVIDVALQHNQPQGILLINQLPLDILCAKNKKGETLLHKTAYKNNLDAFKPVLNQINKLAGTDKYKVVQGLFEKTKAGKTVWEYIYLSELGGKPIFSDTNLKMFEHAINTVKINLQQEDWSTILKDIDTRERTSRLKGGISKEYADQLRKMVNSARNSPPPPAQS